MKAECGTNSGYSRHNRLKEEVCAQCRQAHNNSAKKWRDNNPDKLHAIRQRTYETQGEYIRKKAIEYGESHREERKEYYDQYYSNNKEKFNGYSRKRRALKVENGHEKYTTQEVLDAYGTDCHICLKEIDMTAPRHNGDDGWENGLHIDHVIPLKHGGPDMLSNVKPAHGLCNSKKNAQLSYV